MCRAEGPRDPGTAPASCVHQDPGHPRWEMIPRASRRGDFSGAGPKNQFAPPPDAQQPGSWRRHRSVLAGRSPQIATRRKRVDPARRHVFAGVVTVVAEHVADRACRLSGRGENVRVISVGEYRPTSAGARVEPLGEPDCQALHPARKRGLSFGLDDEVQVIALDGVVDDAHAVQLAGNAKDFFDDLGAAPGPQVSDSGNHPERHVDGVPDAERRPREVRNTRPHQPRPGMLSRAARAFAPTAPLWQIECKLPTHRT
jgi:hypothetical protein